VAAFSGTTKLRWKMQNRSCYTFYCPSDTKTSRIIPANNWKLEPRGHDGNPARADWPGFPQ